MNVSEFGRSLRTQYGIHGSNLVVESSDALLASAAAEVLAPFGSRGAGSTSEVSRVILHAIADRGSLPDDLIRVPDRCEKLANDANLPYSLYRDGRRWVVDFGAHGSTALDLQRREVTVYVVNPRRLPPDTLASFVRLAVIELLRLDGLYAVHAAVLAKARRCVAIIGPSGRGKTTSAVALMRAGYRCLSDDSPLLRESGGRAEFLPFASRVSVTDRTISMFEELTVAAASFRVDSRKRSFAPEDLYRTFPRAGARPVALLFPQIVDRSESRLEALAPARAFEELLPQTLLLLEREVAVDQFAVLSRLVRNVPCYRLHFGGDVPNLPALVDPLLAGIAIS